MDVPKTLEEFRETFINRNAENDELHLQLFRLNVAVDKHGQYSNCSSSSTMFNISV